MVIHDGLASPDYVREDPRSASLLVSFATHTHRHNRMGLGTKHNRMDAKDDELHSLTRSQGAPSPIDSESHRHGLTLHFHEHGRIITQWEKPRQPIPALTSTGSCAIGGPWALGGCDLM